MDQEFDFEWEERKDNVPFKNHFFAGSIAGLSEHLFFLPIDNIKTHIQASNRNFRESFKLIRKTGLFSFF